MSSYTLTGARLKGYIELQYTEGLLTCISMAIKEPLNDVQFSALISSVTQKESDIGQLSRLGLNIAEVLPTNQKIALFCRLYEFYKKIKYRVSPADSGKIKLVKIDEDILRAYFTTDNFLFNKKHSVSNLVRYYNELLAEIASGQKTKHPDHWSKQYEDKLDDNGRKDYWAYLRSIGLKAVKDRLGNTTDWIKNELTNY